MIDSKEQLNEALKCQTMEWTKFKDEYPKPNTHIMVRIRKNIYQTRIWKYSIYIDDVAGTSMRWVYYTDYCKQMEKIPTK